MPKVNKREAKRVVKIVSEETQAMPSSKPYFNVEFAPGRFLVYSRFNERDLIHVREYVTMGERTYPSKKGVCFTPGRLSALMSKLAEIDEEREQQRVTAAAAAAANAEPQQVSYKTHLGAGISVEVASQFNGVDLRRYWAPKGQLSIVPTKNGLYLPASQWSSLKERLSELLAAHPELSTAEECFHPNQIGFMDCPECLPFGWMLSSLNGLE